VGWNLRKKLQKSHNGLKRLNLIICDPKTYPSDSICPPLRMRIFHQRDGAGGGRIKPAVLVARGRSVADAEALLAASGGNLRRALG
jgi:hypothetical protein